MSNHLLDLDVLRPVGNRIGSPRNDPNVLACLAEMRRRLDEGPPLAEVRPSLRQLMESLGRLADGVIAGAQRR
jgi:hypothetical protein